MFYWGRWLDKCLWDIWNNMKINSVIITKDFVNVHLTPSAYSPCLFSLSMVSLSLFGIFASLCFPPTFFFFLPLLLWYFCLSFLLTFFSLFLYGIFAFLFLFSSDISLSLSLSLSLYGIFSSLFFSMVFLLLFYLLW